MITVIFAQGYAYFFNQNKNATGIIVLLLTLIQINHIFIHVSLGQIVSMFITYKLLVELKV